MDPKTSEALEIVRKACDAVSCDGPSRRMIEAALAHLESKLSPAPKQ
jgi:hypothetical protein